MHYVTSYHSDCIDKFDTVSSDNSSLDIKTAFSEIT